MIRFGINLWKRRCMRLKGRIWRGAGNRSNSKTWQERRKMLFKLLWTEGQKGEYETLSVKNYFFRGLESRLHTIWKCCSTASSQHLHYNIFSKGWDSCVVWLLQVPVCAILFLSYKDQCEPYCTHCDVERGNGNMFIEIFPQLWDGRTLSSSLNILQVPPAYSCWMSV